VTLTVYLHIHITGDELIALNGEQLGGLRHREAVGLFQKLQPGIIQLTARSQIFTTSAARYEEFDIKSCYLSFYNFEVLVSS